MSKIISKILNYLILLAIIFLIGKNVYENNVARQKLNQPKYEFVLSLDEVRNQFHLADSIAQDGISSYLVFENQDVVGKVVNTSPYSDDIFGYNSITPLTIYLDKNDRIVEVVLCPNRESRGYINNVIKRGYLESWNGMTPEEVLCHHVDAVSGCTYSSIAISQSLQVRMQELTSQKKKFNSWDWSLFVKQLFVLIVTILALICFFNPKKTKVLRRVTLLLSILILGFWSNSLLSLAMFYNWITNGVSLTMQWAIIIIAFVSIILPLVTKKSFYCKYLSSII